MKHVVYLALGSNLGARRRHLELAIKALQPEVDIMETSSVYETEPWGIRNQPDYLNQVLRGETALSPPDLLRHVKSIEQEMGREPGPRYGPRVIDIDILFYEDLVQKTEELHIPHARMEERAFVLVPLAEIAPNLLHPELGRKIVELLEEVEVDGVRPIRDGERQT